MKYYIICQIFFFFFNFLTFYCNFIFMDWIRYLVKIRIFQISGVLDIWKITDRIESQINYPYGAERITDICSVPPLIVHLHNLYTVTKIDREKHRITIIVLYKSMFIMIFIYCILLYMHEDCNLFTSKKKLWFD